MNFKDLLKKYWFIGIVFVLLVVFLGVYTVNYIQSQPVTVNTKQVDGQYVMYSIDDENVTADDIYDQLYENYGLSAELTAYQKLVCSEAVETTDDMQTTASTYAASVLSSKGEDYCISLLKTYGYPADTDYLANLYIDLYLKEMEVIKQYALANEDTYITPEIGTDGRLIYHILISVDDIEEVTDADGNVTEYKANPTEEESEKLQEVLDALDAGTDFKTVAYNYSDDSGTSSYGGYVGIVSTETASNYVSTFAQASLELADGEVSDPVVSKYGYHIIYNAGTTVDEIIEDQYFISNLTSTYSDLATKAIISKGKELNITVNSDDLNEYITSVESEEE